MVELLDDRQEVLFRAGGLLRSAAGSYTLTLPTSLLPRGGYELRVHHPATGEGALRYLVGPTTPPP